MLTRNFNQDPIEFFFVSIRGIGFRNINPNCIGFESAYKTLLLNNFSSSHSVGSNCEQDLNSFLQSYHFLSKYGNENEAIPPQNVVNNAPLNIIIENSADVDGSQQRNFVCGWILKKVLQNVSKSCQQCRRNLCGSSNSIKLFYMGQRIQ